MEDMAWSYKCTSLNRSPKDDFLKVWPYCANYTERKSVILSFTGGQVKVRILQDCKKKSGLSKMGHG